LVYKIDTILKKQGLKQAEAAEILGVPEGTFKSRALAAKRAVKEAWGKLMRSKGRPPR